MTKGSGMADFSIVIYQLETWTQAENVTLNKASITNCISNVILQ